MYLLYTCMNTHIWISRLISGLISIAQASSLRDRYYTLEHRVEVLETALADIERISESRVAVSERLRLIQRISRLTRRQQ